MARLLTRCCIVAPLFMLAAQSLVGCICFEACLQYFLRRECGFHRKGTIPRTRSINLWDPDVRQSHHGSRR